MVRYKYTVVLVHAMKPKENGGIAPYILSVGTKWGRVIILSANRLSRGETALYPVWTLLGNRKTFGLQVNRPKIPLFSSPFEFEKVLCVTSVTYTLLCGVCFSDDNRQQRTGSCSIMYRSPWNCTCREATTRCISTTWLIVASSV